MRATLKVMYRNKAIGIDNLSDACLVNSNHDHRLKNLLDEVVSNGAKVLAAVKIDGSENYITPTFLENITPVRTDNKI
jgi:acyl-CoA reductase-like NAD-dependent aldehyde dehydrogenase